MNREEMITEVKELEAQFNKKSQKTKESIGDGILKLSYSLVDEIIRNGTSYTIDELLKIENDIFDLF